MTHCACYVKSSLASLSFANMTDSRLKLITHYTLNVRSRGKQIVLFLPRLMFPETKSRETSGLEGK